jgi:hypothetical protein
MNRSISQRKQTPKERRFTNRRRCIQKASLSQLAPAQAIRWAVCKPPLLEALAKSLRSLVSKIVALSRA